MTNKSDSENSRSEEEEQQSASSEESQDFKNHESDQELDSSTNQSVINKTPKKQDKISQPTGLESTAIQGLIAAIVVLFFAIYALHMYGINIKKQPVSIDKLKQIFPNEPDDVFDNFETIIDEIVFERAVHPAVFLFLYDKNEKKVNELVEHLAIYASHQLKTTENFIDVHRNEFHTKEAKADYGSLIDKYKADIIKKKVMIVKNLHDIPGETAQIFHSFCDEISPLVEKVVYIFTLKVESINGKLEKIAETNLKRVWSDLENDILMPLITRVTSTVLKISN